LAPPTPMRSPVSFFSITRFPFSVSRFPKFGSPLENNTPKFFPFPLSLGQSTKTLKAFCFCQIFPPSLRPPSAPAHCLLVWRPSGRCCHPHGLFCPRLFFLSPQFLGPLSRSVSVVQSFPLPCWPNDSPRSGFFATFRKGSLQDRFRGACALF